MTGQDLLEQWFRKIWVEGDLSAIHELMAHGTPATGMMAFAIGPGDFEDLVPAFHALVDEIDLRVIRTVEAGDWVSGLIAIDGRAAQDGRPVRFSGQVMARIESGRFAEAYNTFDFLSAFEQLRLLPADTIPLCLSGQGVSG